LDSSGSKIFTEPDVYNKTKGGNNRNIYVKALYNIFDAMKGLRIFDRFGFDLPKIKTDRYAPRIVTNYQTWEYAPENFDWLNTETNRALSGFIPTHELLNLIENKIDIEQE